MTCRRIVLMTVVVYTLSISSYALGKGTLGLFGDRHPDVLYSVTTDKPLIALTIDDGPDPTSTQRILEVLSAN